MRAPKNVQLYLQNINTLTHTKQKWRLWRYGDDDDDGDEKKQRKYERIDDKLTVVRVRPQSIRKPPVTHVQPFINVVLCFWVCKHMSYGANLCSYSSHNKYLNVILWQTCNKDHLSMAAIWKFRSWHRLHEPSLYESIRLTIARCWKNVVTEIPILQMLSLLKAFFPTKNVSTKK